jgi:hypothetical protein
MGGVVSLALQVTGISCKTFCLGCRAPLQCHAMPRTEPSPFCLGREYAGACTLPFRHDRSYSIFIFEAAHAEDTLCCCCPFGS